MDGDEIREVETTEDAAQGGEETQNVVAQTDSGRLALEKQFERGANWFYWIAALSVVNSAAVLSGVEWTFVIGLGITLVVDLIVVEEDPGLKARIAVFGFDLIIASGVVLFGYLARKRLRWVFVLGMVLYAVDGLWFLLAGDVFSLGFHAFALFGIFGGFRACGQLKAMDRARIDAVQSQPMAGMIGAESAASTLPAKEVVWPGVIGIVSFMYAVFYSAVSIGDWPNYGMLTGCVLLFGGIAGVYLKRRVAVKLFYGGAGVIIFYTFYRFIAGTVKSAGEMSTGGLIFGTIITLSLIGILLIWPVFLVIWFLRKAVRQHVETEWT
jgi:hypothetical protein